jgi:TRAP-type C4-dicarboxylate transport system substrate-binding protein
MSGNVLNLLKSKEGKVMKKKVILGLFVLALVMVPLFSVCNGAEKSKPVELRFSVHIPPFAPPVKIYQEWADQVAAATDGKIKVTIYAGSTLLPLPDVVTGVKSGIADIGLVVSEVFANERPLTPILTLPFMGLGDWQDGVKIMQELREEFPALNDEWKDFKILFREIRTGSGIHTKTPVRVPEDLKGQKIIAQGMWADIVNSVGGSAVSLFPPDWYTSLDRGVASGMFIDLGALYEMKVYTLLPNHTDFPHGMSLQLGMIVMNLDKWNSLSPDIQKAIDGVSGAMETKIAQMTVDVNKQYKANMEKEGGHNFIMLTDKEAKEWFDVASPEHEKYLEKAEARGLPAKAIYKKALKLAKKAHK